MIFRFYSAFMLIAGLLLPTVADDHGNTPETATFFSSSINGTINYDTDVDWFKFLAAPSLVYTINVNNVTLWDNAFSIKAFAEGDVVRSTNSAFSTSPSRIVWTNTGGLRHYYIGVSAMFQFTTGNYAVVVSANDADGNANGMVDAWEMMHFGSLTNLPGGDFDADGMSNWDEYVTGTNPADPTSRLAVTNQVRSVSGAIINWPGVPYAVYRVESTTNLVNPGGWQFRERFIRQDTHGSETFIDAQATNQMRHYRVIYE